MNIRTARKIISCRKGLSKRMEKRLNKLYPPYYNEQGHYCMPSWHTYYRFQKAWVIVKRKQRMYQNEFRLL